MLIIINYSSNRIDERDKKRTKTKIWKMIRRDTLYITFKEANISRLQLLWCFGKSSEKNKNSKNQIFYFLS